MAFIREYMNQGDPFSLRIPRRVRKWRPGRTLKGMLPLAAQFVPGAGAALGFARGFGLDIGDPSGRRKNAGAGPKAKAAKKAAKRGHPAKMKKPSHGGKHIDWNAIGNAATSLLPVGGELAKTVMQQAGITHDPADAEDAMTSALQSGMVQGTAMPLHPAVRKALGLHHRRRSMNPANTKALRRSIRRVEGFERLVKSVYRAFPRLKPHAGGHGGARMRGHKSGCGCVGCRKK